MRAVLKLISLWLSLAGSGAALAQEPSVSALTQLDRQYMQQQRDNLDQVSRRNLGRQISGSKQNDIEVLQLLLDRRAVRSEQTAELQAMGMVLGDLLAQELRMDWVIYADKLGRSRALRMPGTDEYLFPVTMISRRVEAGARVDVAAVYDKAYRLMKPYARPLPFQ